MAKTMDLGKVQGTEGKTAYQYAQEGGYTGTEAEFQALMAAVPTHAADATLHISTTAKETVADGDSLVLSDSADSGKSKRVLWSEVKELLGQAIKPSRVSITLTAAGWDSSAKTQTVAAAGVLADETAQLITICPAAASGSAFYDAGILCTAQAADSLTFTATVLPTVDLTVYVVLQGVTA